MSEGRMRVHRDLDRIPPGHRPSAVTIGKFDGVHLGHQRVIAALVAAARAESLDAVAITFDRNPLRLIAPERCPEDLVGLERKLELLAETGLDETVVLAFDRALASLSPDEFVARVLVGALDARIVLVGRDFRYGARNAGDVDTLRAAGERHGFRVRLVDDVAPEDGRRVSSSWIRGLIADGDVAHAARLLGHAPSVSGVVVHGAKRGRALGFPTANLSPESTGLIPADGVYAGRLVDDAGVARAAAISVGDNPTFDAVPQKQVEAYVIDADLDLYDRRVRIDFVERIRGMIAFEGVEPLIARMHDDVERVRAVLASADVAG